MHQGLVFSLKYFLKVCYLLTIISVSTATAVGKHLLESRVYIDCAVALLHWFNCVLIQRSHLAKVIYDHLKQFIVKKVSVNLNEYVYSRSAPQPIIHTYYSSLSNFIWHASHRQKVLKNRDLSLCMCVKQCWRNIYIYNKQSAPQPSAPQPSW